NDQVMILYGDIPMITSETLHKLQRAASESGFSLLTSYIDNPAGYGRIIRNDIGDVIRIVEEKDAEGEERSICEINTGMMVVAAEPLKRWVNVLGNKNAQKEYYLTDIIKMAVDEGVTVNTINPDS